MTFRLRTIAAFVAAASLTACAGEYAYGPPGPYGDVGYMAYYDDYYGAFDGGYWGPRGYFYYPDHAAGRFHRDAGHHFRRDAAPGFHPIQGHAPPAASGRGPRGGGGSRGSSGGHRP